MKAGLYIATVDQKCPAAGKTFRQKRLFFVSKNKNSKKQITPPKIGDVLSYCYSGCYDFYDDELHVDCCILKYTSINPASVFDIDQNLISQFKVLFIGCHPDDIELGCSGLILKLRELEVDMHGLILTQGSASNENLRTRQKETEAAKDKLGFESLRVLKFPDTKLRDTGEVVKAIRKEIEATRSFIIFTHSEHDRHNDHRYAFLSTVSATRYELVYCYEVIPSSWTNRFTPCFGINISSYYRRKINILKTYKSQVDRGTIDLDEVREHTSMRGKQHDCKYAETFEDPFEIGSVFHAISKCERPDLEAIRKLDSFPLKLIE